MNRFNDTIEFLFSRKESGHYELIDPGTGHHLPSISVKMGLCSRGARARTADLCVPNAARYHLRHTPRLLARMILPAQPVVK